MADTVRTTTIAAEVISATPLPFVFTSQLALEIIVSRAIIATSTTVSATAAASLSGVVVHIGTFTATATASASASGSANSPFVGWGIPISL